MWLKLIKRIICFIIQYMALVAKWIGRMFPK